MSEHSRYERQTILDEIGEDGQKKLSAASVLVVGAGGLGCPALLYLAAAGIGNIGIIDFDRVEEGNLQRQTLYTTDQIGTNKAKAAKERLSALNPEIEIHACNEKLDHKNAPDRIEKYDIIIDGTDNFNAKYLINDVGAKFRKPVIYGALQGFEGQLSVFDAENGACYRCLYPEPPKQHIPTCAENGVIGAVAGIIGTAQAMEAIKLIVGGKTFHPLKNKLFCVDMRDMRTRTLSIPKNPSCKTCSAKREDIKLPSNPQTDEIEQILPEETHEDAYLIDVREQDEWDAGFINGAHHVPLSFLMNNPAPSLPIDKDIVLYCAKGVRSQHAAEILQAQGYSRLKNMRGGYYNWLKRCG